MPSKLILCLLLLASPVAAQQIETPISATAPVDFLRFTAPDGRWAIATFGPTANAGDSTRPDTAMTWGWNTTADGARFNTSEHALMWRLENYYKPTSGGDSYLEAHLQYVNPSGTVLRPFAWQFTRGTDFIYGHVLADAFNYLGPTGTQYVKWIPGQQMLLNGMIVAGYTNNAKPFRQAKAGGSLVSLVNVNASDKIEIGDAAAGNIVFKASVLEIGSETGVTLDGASCSAGTHVTITKITGGLVTAASCVP